MHADELPVDVALARALLEDQFPEWADLQLERVASFGTDNALFRLGGDMVVRLPRIEWATRDIEKDARWLEQLRPLWGIYRWLDGENPVVGAIARPKELARDIG